MTLREPRRSTTAPRPSATRSAPTPAPGSQTETAARPTDAGRDRRRARRPGADRRGHPDLRRGRPSQALTRASASSRPTSRPADSHRARGRRLGRRPACGSSPRRPSRSSPRSSTPSSASSSPASSAATRRRARRSTSTPRTRSACSALISLSLAIINLFPFLPLDGGHIFWSLVEKVRGSRVSFATMERASAIGFMLILFLFFIGLSNDIDRLTRRGLRHPEPGAVALR